MELIEVPLHPEAAKVGLAVRVPGSDAGEKLAILSGVLARIDRPAPNYGSGYCDFNTFYVQASANTSGGSSGSPVIDINGRAVALNAGGASHAASSFFLPLEGVCRALDLLIRDQHVPRGTLQVEFHQKQYDEARRLGLSMSMEKTFREKSPDIHGVLAVKNVIPNGCGDGKLMAGDLIISCEGKYINHFVELSEALDSKSDPTLREDQRTIRMEVLRDRQIIEVDNLPVQSLYDITPHSYIEIGGALLHPLSFCLARSYLHPLFPNGPVFISDAGHMATPDIDTFIEMTRNIAVGERIPIRYYSLSKKNVEMVKVVIWENKWGRYRRAFRDDSIGSWRYETISALPSSKPPKLLNSASFLNIDPNRNLNAQLASISMPSLCVVEAHAPFGINGYNSKFANGVGIIVDASLGLVLVDRSTIPTPLVRIYCCFANQAIVSAKVVFVHPVYNLCWIVYDTSINANLPLKSVTFADELLGPGDEVYLATLNATTQIPRIVTTAVKAVGHFVFADSSPPKFRIMNWDHAITLEKSPNESGVLMNKEGKAIGVWLVTPEGKSQFGMSLSRTSHTRIITEAIIQNNLNFETVAAISRQELGLKLPGIRVIDVELTETYFLKAKLLGLSQEAVSRISQARVERFRSRGIRLMENGEGDMNGFGVSNFPEDVVQTGDTYSVVTVRRTHARYDSKEDPTGAREGDLILECNSVPVSDMGGELLKIMNMSTVDASQSRNLPLDLTVLRDGAEMKITVPTVLLSGVASVDVVHWAGAIFQEPHRSLFFHVKRIPKGIYLSLLHHGSPAHGSHLSACWFLVEVDGKKTHTLDDLLEAVEGPSWRSKVPLVNPIESGWDRVTSMEEAWPTSATTATPTTTTTTTNGVATDNLNTLSLKRKRIGSEEEVLSTGEMLTSPVAVDGKMTAGMAFDTQSFRLKLTSLEQATKVVTVDVCAVSRLFWPTWRCTLD
ncbi:hypothetical protein HDU76_001683 [Blyttiomyces sp. JEL0837]|nr:hypothetical protein HDU76_001683 [Blyttiomyces sp. JEL0837]